MNKSILKLIMPLFAVLLLASIASAYSYYGDDYKKEYAIKETYDDSGYSFYEKNAEKTPWGEVTTYTKVKDTRGYDARNRALDYWQSGQYQGYSRTYRVVETQPRHMGYDWDDSYRRTIYDTQYTDYYYHPRYFYNGDYYNWEGNEPRCGSDVRCTVKRSCGSSSYNCNW